MDTCSENNMVLCAIFCLIKNTFLKVLFRILKKIIPVNVLCSILYVKDCIKHYFRMLKYSLAFRKLVAFKKAAV